MALNGIVFVLRTGIPWEELPQELGFGSGMTCWRRLRDWQAAGVWHRLHLLLLDELRGAGNWLVIRSEPDRIRWSTTSSSACAACGVISPNPKSSRTSKLGLTRRASNVAREPSKMMVPTASYRALALTNIVGSRMRHI